jgi:penicillin-binding protein 2
VTGIELPQEKTGLIPTKEWKKKRTGTAWHGGDTVLLSIGQGSVLTTPLQLGVLMARLATNNLAFKPTIVRSFEKNQDPPIFQDSLKAVSDKDLERIKKGLNAAVNEPGGTAYGARIIEDGWQMAGKTTTAQVTRITLQQRNTRIPEQHELPWKHRHHAMFAGYAPVHDPRFALAVVIEHGGGGGKVAAPVARDLMKATLKRYS